MAGAAGGTGQAGDQDAEAVQGLHPAALQALQGQAGEAWATHLSVLLLGHMVHNGVFAVVWFVFPCQVPDNIRANLIRMINFCEDGEFVKVSSTSSRTSALQRVWHYPPSHPVDAMMQMREVVGAGVER